MNLIAMAYTKDTKLKQICIFAALVKYSERGKVSKLCDSERRYAVTIEKIIISWRSSFIIQQREGFLVYVSFTTMRVLSRPASMYIIFSVIFLSHVDEVTSANATTNTTGESISIQHFLVSIQSCCWRILEIHIHCTFENKEFKIVMINGWFQMFFFSIHPKEYLSPVCWVALKSSFFLYNVQ